MKDGRSVRVVRPKKQINDTHVAFDAQTSALEVAVHKYIHSQTAKRDPAINMCLVI